MTTRSTLYLRPDTWDLAIDSNGNIAAAFNPYQLAQDVASACRTVLAEVYYDTTQGVPYFADILGQHPTDAIFQSLLETAALTVPGVIAAKVYITRVVDRGLTGQVHVTDSAGVVTTANF